MIAAMDYGKIMQTSVELLSFDFQNNSKLDKKFSTGLAVMLNNRGAI
jgi:hypothetical protein